MQSPVAGTQSAAGRRLNWITPRLLVLVGLWAALTLSAAWAIATAAMVRLEAASGLVQIAIAFAVLGPPPAFAAWFLVRVIRRSNVRWVGAYGTFLVLYGVPFSILGCPLWMPGLLLIGASIWGYRRQHQA